MEKTSILLVKGLDFSKPAEYIADEASPNERNMMMSRSELFGRYGTSLLGVALSGTNPDIMGGIELRRQQVDYNIRVGIKKVQHWNTTTSTWDDITGSDLTGTVDDPISLTTPLLSGKRIVVLTNLIDVPRKWDGSGNTAALGGSPPKAKFCLAFDAYLLLAYTDNGSQKFPARVQWPDTGAIETWTGGNSGSKDLSDDGDDITGLASYGSYAAVHKKGAIYLGYLVSSSSVFKFDRKNVHGTICNNTIQTLPTGDQAYLAVDGIRLFNGISAPLIESPIMDELRESINSLRVGRAWSALVPTLDEYWLGVPIGSEEYGTTIYKYNYRTNVCLKDVRIDMRSAWLYTKGTTSSVPWDDGTTTPWDSEIGRWDDSNIQSSFKQLIVSDRLGKSYELDSTVLNDAGEAIDHVWESKDFIGSRIGMLCRWQELEVWAKGDSVDVSYSTDSGVTWQDAGTLTLTDQYPSDDAPLKVYFDVIATRFRVRFRNYTAGETFYMKQYSIQYLEGEQR